jgi:hypothetical protein
MTKLRLSVIAAIAVTLLPAFAEDWTTNDGKTYQNVKVMKVEVDCVTILDSDGGARIELAKLPPDVQKKLGYDPEKAKAAAEQRAADDKANAAALQAEMDQAEAQKQAKLQADAKTDRAAEAQSQMVKNPVTLVVKVNQVLPNGVLADKMEAHYNAPVADSMASVGGGGGVAGGGVYYEESGTTIFIEMPASGLAEGQQLTVKVARNSTYTFTDTNGASRTIEKWIKVDNGSSTSSAP